MINLFLFVYFFVGSTVRFCCGRTCSLFYWALLFTVCDVYLMLIDPSKAFALLSQSVQELVQSLSLALRGANRHPILRERSCGCQWQPFCPHTFLGSTETESGQPDDAKDLFLPLHAPSNLSGDGLYPAQELPSSHLKKQ